MPGLSFLDNFISPCRDTFVTEVLRPRTSTYLNWPQFPVERLLTSQILYDKGLTLLSNGSIAQATDLFASSMHLQLYPFMDGPEAESWRFAFLESSQPFVSLRTRLAETLLHFAKSCGLIGYKLNDLESLDISYMALEATLSLCRNLEDMEAQLGSLDSGVNTFISWKNPPSVDSITNEAKGLAKRLVEFSVSSLANKSVDDLADALKRFGLEKEYEELCEMVDIDPHVELLKLLTKGLHMPIHLTVDYVGSQFRVTLRNNFRHVRKDEIQEIGRDSLFRSIVQAEIVAESSVRDQVRTEIGLRCWETTGVHGCQQLLQSNWKSGNESFQDVIMNKEDVIASSHDLIDKTIAANDALQWLDMVLRTYSAAVNPSFYGIGNLCQSFPNECDESSMLRDSSWQNRTIITLPWHLVPGLKTKVRNYRRQLQGDVAGEKDYESIQFGEECINANSIFDTFFGSDLQYIQENAAKLRDLAGVQMNSDVPYHWPSNLRVVDNSHEVSCSNGCGSSSKRSRKVSSKSPAYFGRSPSQIFEQKYRLMTPQTQHRVHDPRQVANEIISTKEDFVAPLLITIAYFFGVMAVGGAAAYVAGHKKRQPIGRQKHVAASIKERALAETALRDAMSGSNYAKLAAALKSAEESGAEKPLLKKAKAYLQHLKKRRGGGNGHGGVQSVSQQSTFDTPSPSIAKLLRETTSPNSFNAWNGPDEELEEWSKARERACTSKMPERMQSVMGAGEGEDTAKDTGRDPMKEKDASQQWNVVAVDACHTTKGDKSPDHDLPSRGRREAKKHTIDTPPHQSRSEKPKSINCADASKNDLHALGKMSSLKDSECFAPSMARTAKAASRLSMEVVPAKWRGKAAKSVAVVHAEDTEISKGIRRPRKNQKGKSDRNSPSKIVRTVSAPPAIGGNDDSQYTTESSLEPEAPYGTSGRSSKDDQSPRQQKRRQRRSAHRRWKKTVPDQAKTHDDDDDDDETKAGTAVKIPLEKGRQDKRKLDSGREQEDHKDIGDGGGLKTPQGDQALAAVWQDAIHDAMSSVITESNHSLQALNGSHHQGSSSENELVTVFRKQRSSSHDPLTPQAFMPRPIIEGTVPETERAAMLYTDSALSSILHSGDDVQPWTPSIGIMDFHQENEKHPQTSGGLSTLKSSEMKDSMLSISTPSQISSFAQCCGTISGGSALLEMSSSDVAHGFTASPTLASQSIELLASLQHIWGSSSQDDSGSLPHTVEELNGVYGSSLMSVFGSSPFIAGINVPSWSGDGFDNAYMRSNSTGALTPTLNMPVASSSMPVSGSVPSRSLSGNVENLQSRQDDMMPATRIRSDDTGIADSTTTALFADLDFFS